MCPQACVRSWVGVRGSWRAPSVGAQERSKKLHFDTFFAGHFKVQSKMPPSQRMSAVQALRRENRPRATKNNPQPKRQRSNFHDKEIKRMSKFMRYVAYFYVLARFLGPVMGYPLRFGQSPGGWRSRNYLSASTSTTGKIPEKFLKFIFFKEQLFIINLEKNWSPEFSTTFNATSELGIFLIFLKKKGKIWKLMSYS